MRIEDARLIVATRILLALALAITVVVLSAGASQALEPGVHVDPGSPAAKEYALPLNQARQTGSSHSGLFGAGIRRAPSKPTGPSSSASSSDAKEPGTRTRTSAHQEVQPSRSGAADSLAEANRGTLPAAVQSASRAHATSSGSLLALLGGGVVVLVLGILGGTVLRGHRSVAGGEAEQRTIRPFV